MKPPKICEADVDYVIEIIEQAIDEYRNNRAIDCVSRGHVRRRIKHTKQPDTPYASRCYQELSDLDARMQEKRIDLLEKIIAASAMYTNEIETDYDV